MTRSSREALRPSRWTRPPTSSTSPTGTSIERVIVFEADTGEYRRHWGAYGNVPHDDPVPDYDPAGEPAQQFRGPVHGITLSRDEDQRFLYVPDGTNYTVWVLDRQSLDVVGSFGRQGRNAGPFQWVHNLAVDSQGNIFTSEVDTGKRVQKFVPANR
jgi:hypothetical protein